MIHEGRADGQKDITNLRVACGSRIPLKGSIHVVLALKSNVNLLWSHLIFLLVEISTILVTHVSNVHFSCFRKLLRK